MQSTSYIVKKTSCPVNLDSSDVASHARLSLPNSGDRDRWLCGVWQKEQNVGMATESIGLPGQLLEKVRQAAAKEEITPEEFVRDAVETRLNRSEWSKTLEFGDRNARERGLKPTDVETEIAAVRSDRIR